MFNAPVDLEQIRDLDDEPWRAISPRYKILLRLQILLYGIVLLPVPAVLVLVADLSATLAASLSLLLFVVFLVLVIAWVPRRVRHSRYLLRELDFHVQTGLWWRRTSSVAISRVQHLEIAQGPVERSLGLSRLMVYTAGGMKSDLIVPGLPADTAAQLKTQMLAAAEREDADHESR